MLVPRDAVTIVGDVKYYDAIGDSGSVVGRGFCPNYGARVLSKPLRNESGQMIWCVTANHPDTLFTDRRINSDRHWENKFGV
jgi:hypothetical protein